MLFRIFLMSVTIWIASNSSGSAFAFGPSSKRIAEDYKILQDYRQPYRTGESKKLQKRLLPLLEKLYPNDAVILKIEMLSEKKKNKEYTRRLQAIKTRVKEIESTALLDENFLIFGNRNLDESAIVFLANMHADLKGSITEIAVLNRYFRPGDVLLREGMGLRFDGLNCATDIYDNAISVQLFSENYRAFDYHPGKMFRIANAIRIPTEQAKTLAKQEFGSSPFKDCTGWDDTKLIMSGLLGGNEIGYDTTRGRNKKMVASIEENEDKANRIFVSAGLAHLPVVDYLMGIESNSIPTLEGMEKFFQFYTVNEPENKASSIGSTVDIYNFLKTKSFTVLIPKSAIEGNGLGITDEALTALQKVFASQSF